ncbi:MAG: tetratricopeptide repeat protein [Candidatus Methylomirabilia bacterium]
MSLARAGRAGEAVPLLEKAAGLDPENPVIRQHLAVAKAQITASSGMPGSLPAGKR